MANGGACGFHRLRGNRNPPARRQPHKSIAQIFSAVEQKKQQHDYQQRVDDQIDDWRNRLQPIGERGLHRHRHHFARFVLLRIHAFHPLLNVGNRILDVLEPRGRGLFQRRQLVSDVIGIVGDLVGDLGQFNSQEVPHRGDEADHKQHYQRGADEAAAVILEARSDRTEDNAQNQRDRKRQQNRLAEIQRGGTDDQYAGYPGNPKQREAAVAFVIILIRFLFDFRH